MVRRARIRVKKVYLPVPGQCLVSHSRIYSQQDTVGLCCSFHMYELHSNKQDVI